MRKLMFILAGTGILLAACAAPATEAPSPTETIVPTETPFPTPNLVRANPDEVAEAYQKIFTELSWARTDTGLPRWTGISDDGCVELSIQPTDAPYNNGEEWKDIIVVHFVDLYIVDNPDRCSWDEQTAFLDLALSAWDLPDYKAETMAALLDEDVPFGRTTVWEGEEGQGLQIYACTEEDVFWETCTVRRHACGFPSQECVFYED